MIPDSQSLCEHLSETFKGCSDFAVRKTLLPCGTSLYVASFIVFCDKTYISDSIIRPCLYNTDVADIKDRICVSKLIEVEDENGAVTSLLEGSALIFYDTDGKTFAFKADAKSGIGRSVSEPDSEVVVRGPREGFVENAEINVALLRRRIKSQRLMVESVSCGKITDTGIFIVYLDGVADKKVVDKVKKRLSSIDIESVIDSGYIEHFLCDSKYPIFQEVGNSEKPDKVAAKLVGGRVAVICNGSPCVLTVPYFFVESIQSAEDYLKTPYYATFVRIIRLIGIAISLYLPALYIALLRFDSPAVPHKLLSTISKARADVPFSLFTEFIVILLIFEVIREVGVRMPRAVGDAVSIVAGIILGDAAIKAGIASAPVIMVAAITATCSFIDPPYMNSIPLIRFINIIFSRLFGLCGLVLCIFFLVAILCTKVSYGRPYLTPFSPLRISGLTDSIFLLPKKALRHRESEITGDKS